MSFSHLPTDALLDILADCDVEDVLCVERTCTALRDVIALRYLWTSLLLRLPDKHAPTLYPGASVESLTTEVIREIVIRAVRGCKNLESPHPTVTRKTEVLLNNPSSSGHSDIGIESGSINIVPNGKYIVVLWITGFLQIRKVLTGEPVWTYPSVQSERRIDKYDVGYSSESTGGGLKISIIAVSRLDPSLDRYMDVMVVDPQTGNSETKFSQKISSSGRCLLGISLHGSLASVYNKENVVLVDLERGRCLALQPSVTWILYSVKLVDGYLLIFMGRRHKGEGKFLVIDACQALESVPQSDDVVPMLIFTPAESDFIIACKDVGIQGNFSGSLSVFVHEPTFIHAVHAHWRRDSNIRILLCGQFSVVPEGSPRTCPLVIETFMLSPRTKTSLPALVQLSKLDSMMRGILGKIHTCRAGRVVTAPTFAGDVAKTSLHTMNNFAESFMPLHVPEHGGLLQMDYISGALLFLYPVDSHDDRAPAMMLEILNYD